MQNQVMYLGKGPGYDPVSTALTKTPSPFKRLKHMIGNTPLLAIRFAYRGSERVVYAKDEHLNMTGSI